MRGTWDDERRETVGMNRPLASAVALCLLLSAAACDPLPQPESATSAEGLWTGSTNTNRTLTAAVLEDGTYYFFYTLVADPTQIAGVIQGTGTSDDGTFRSTDAKDFGIGSSVLDATISATYGQRQFLNGEIAYTGGGTVAFTHSYNAAYDTPPTLASFAGVYQAQVGRSIGYDAATLTVLTDGTFTGGEQNGCTFSGRVTPRTRGNVFDYSNTFGGAPCFFAAATLQGVWYFDITTQRLYAAGLTGRTDAAILFGVRIL